MRSSDPHCVSLGRKRSFQKLESLVQRDPVRAFAHHDLYELDGPAPQKLSYVVLGEVIAHRALRGYRTDPTALSAAEWSHDAIPDPSSAHARPGRASVVNAGPCDALRSVAWPSSSRPTSTSRSVSRLPSSFSSRSALSTTSWTTTPGRRRWSTSRRRPGIPTAPGRER